MFERKDRTLAIIIAGAVAAVVAPLGLWIFSYPGSLIWPGLAGNFTASFLAFLAALAWDRRQRQQERVEEDQQREGAIEEREREAQQRRETEARRRFSAIRDELVKNRESIEEVCKGLAGRIVLPQLLSASWTASGAALGLIVADHDLMARLATFYGRIDELQWRLRFRIEHLALLPDIDNMTLPLAEELAEEVAALLEDVAAQIVNPTVQAHGLLHQVYLTSGAITAGGAMSASATTQT